MRFARSIQTQSQKPLDFLGGPRIATRRVIQFEESHQKTSPNAFNL